MLAPACEHYDVSVRSSSGKAIKRKAMQGLKFVVVVQKPTADTKFGVVLTSLHIGDDAGVVTVRSLADDSAMTEAGLAVGDEILAVNYKKVTGAAPASHSARMLH